MVAQRRRARGGRGEGYVGTGQDRLAGRLGRERRRHAHRAFARAIRVVYGLNLRGAQGAVVKADLVHQTREAHPGAPIVRS